MTVNVSLCDASRNTLVMIDFQQRLMPAIHDADAVLRNAQLLGQGARLLHVPVVGTVQNPGGLGPKLPPLHALCDRLVAKTAFDACAEPGFLNALDPARKELIVAGCEAHVCVLQTVFGLLQRGWRVRVVADAIGSRQSGNKELALERMRSAGAEVVSTEMVLFEWLRDCTHPRFREVLNLVK